MGGIQYGRNFERSLNHSLVPGQGNIKQSMATMNLFFSKTISCLRYSAISNWKIKSPEAMWFGKITTGHNLGEKWPGIQSLPLSLHFPLENWTLTSTPGVISPTKTACLLDCTPPHLTTTKLLTLTARSSSVLSASWNLGSIYLSYIWFSKTLSTFLGMMQF